MTKLAMTKSEFKMYKADLRTFLQTAYADDERLAMLLAHAQSGRLAYHSCCCFIGLATADHALAGKNFVYLDHPSGRHYFKAAVLPGARMAQNAYHMIGLPDDPRKMLIVDTDLRRRRIIIPMIRAEFKRRAALLAQANEVPESAVIAKKEAEWLKAT